MTLRSHLRGSNQMHRDSASCTTHGTPKSADNERYRATRSINIYARIDAILSRPSPPPPSRTISERPVPDRTNDTSSTCARQEKTTKHLARTTAGGIGSGTREGGMGGWEGGREGSSGNDALGCTPRCTYSASIVVAERIPQQFVTCETLDAAVLCKRHSIVKRKCRR